MKVQEYNYEIYTCHPTTGEGGWDIKFASVFASSSKEARENLKKYVPLFDCVILHNFNVDLDDDASRVYANGGNFFFRDHHYKFITAV